MWTAYGRGDGLNPINIIRSVRLVVRTSGFHPGDRGFDSPTEYKYYKFVVFMLDSSSGRKVGSQPKNNGSIPLSSTNYTKCNIQNV
jgi:hypothetical protein